MSTPRSVSRPAGATAVQAIAVQPMPDAARFGVAGSGVIRPGITITSYPSLFYAPLLSHTVPNVGFPQPLGHQVVATGPNSYVYRPVTDLGAFVGRAFAALRAGDYERALVETDPVLTQTPDSGQAWMIRAQAFFALASYSKAAEALQAAMRLLPQEEWGRPVRKSREYFASAEEYSARLSALERYAALHPSDAAAHYVLGYHYGYLGRASEAATQLQMALRLMTGDDALANALLAPLSPAEAALSPAEAALDSDQRPRPGCRLKTRLPKRVPRGNSDVRKPPIWHCISGQMQRFLRHLAVIRPSLGRSEPAAWGVLTLDFSGVSIRKRASKKADHRPWRPKCSKSPICSIGPGVRSKCVCSSCG